MPFFYLQENEFSFPHPFLAEDDGLLAVGGDLHPQRLINAYSWGIFPWYNEEDPILWWCPMPRFVLYPEQVKVSKSMRSYFNNDKFRVSFNQCFDQVIKKCSQSPRNDQDGTWIHPEFIDSYNSLHKMGFAHSVEVWDQGELVGGLYGLSIGKIFYGESMFSSKSNASKFGFIHLAKYLQTQGCQLIDCQVYTDHLSSLGADYIEQKVFWSHIKANLLQDPIGMMADIEKID